MFKNLDLDLIPLQYPHELCDKCLEVEDVFLEPESAVIQNMSS